MDYIETIKQDENFKRLMEIGKANELVTEMQHEVDKYTKLLELAKEDRVATVKHNVNYYQFLFRVKPAFKYFHLEPGTDKRSSEYKTNKLMFKSLQGCLEEVFKKPIKILDMVHGGYENYYHEILFTIPDSDTKFTFTVPDPEVINVKNFEYAYEGKLAFGHYASDHCHYIEKTSYCIEDITKAFEEFINKENE